VIHKQQHALMLYKVPPGICQQYQGTNPQIQPATRGKDKWHKQKAKAFFGNFELILFLILILLFSVILKSGFAVEATP